MTLKMAILAMMISSSAIPMHNIDINKAVEYPRPAEVINYTVTNTSVLDSNKLVDTQVAPVEKVAPAKTSINRDKTYDQCMKEAFERIYEEVNRMLDETVDRCEEQF